MKKKPAVAIHGKEWCGMCDETNGRSICSKSVRLYALLTYFNVLHAGDQQLQRTVSGNAHNEMKKIMDEEACSTEMST